MDVALHVTLGHVTAGAGAVLPSSPSGFCTPSIVSVNTALLWASFQLSAVLPLHLAWCCKALQRIKADIKILSVLVGEHQERRALLWES